ncbi:MAG: HD domain-containing protein [Bacilli bacterium]|nr:HD domain-containing protein [Bacilli bacterium]
MELEWLYDEKQMYLFLRKHCEERKFVNALRSLDHALMSHEGQRRKGNGVPYITHPMSVALFMILSGMDEDIALSVSLLHDVPEDCNTDLHDLNVLGEIKRSANILNWKYYKYRYSNRELAMRLYYEGISKDKWATIVKLGDRTHNLSTMSGAFTPLKMMDYIEETKTYYPSLIQLAYQNYPEANSTIQFLQQRIYGLIQAYEENDFADPNFNFDQKVIDIFNQKVYIPDKKIIVLPQTQETAKKRILNAQ